MAFGDSIRQGLEILDEQNERNYWDEQIENSNYKAAHIKLHNDCLKMKSKITILKDQLQTMSELNITEDLGNIALQEYITRALGEVVNIQDKTAKLESELKSEKPFNPADYATEDEALQAEMENAYTNCRILGEKTATHKLIATINAIQSEVDSHYPDLPEGFLNKPQRYGVGAMNYAPRQTPWTLRESSQLGRILRPTNDYPNAQPQASRKTLVEVGYRQTGVQFF